MSWGSILSSLYFQISKSGEIALGSATGPSLATGTRFAALIRGLFLHLADGMSVMSVQEICDEKKGGLVSIVRGAREGEQGVWKANKILLSIQECTYSLRKDNIRKGFGDFWELKRGLTARATLEGRVLTAKNGMGRFSVGSFRAFSDVPWSDKNLQIDGAVESHFSKSARSGAPAASTSQSASLPRWKRT